MNKSILAKQLDAIKALPKTTDVVEASRRSRLLATVQHEYDATPDDPKADHSVEIEQLKLQISRQPTYSRCRTEAQKANQLASLQKDLARLEALQNPAPAPVPETAKV